MPYYKPEDILDYLDIELIGSCDTHETLCLDDIYISTVRVWGPLMIGRRMTVPSAQTSSLRLSRNFQHIPRIFQRPKFRPPQQPKDILKTRITLCHHQVSTNTSDPSQQKISPLINPKIKRTIGIIENPIYRPQTGNCKVQNS
eukprot:GHVP01017568.1.p1 GENE.GHVP01017568.1~~GHVP01017568.1.p1  ORF type:complete len:143 (-),score=6.38 GHVP01017568.1:167-595(-)